MGMVWEGRIHKARVPHIEKSFTVKQADGTEKTSGFKGSIRRTRVLEELLRLCV